VLKPSAWCKAEPRYFDDHASKPLVPQRVLGHRQHCGVIAGFRIDYAIRM
jgi:hypothetical protein